jgi:hypothetical protein
VAHLIKQNIIICFIVILIASIVGCNEVDPSKHAGRLRISLTEGGGLFLKGFYIDLQSIEVILSDSLGHSTNEWIPLEFTGGVYELSNLTQEKSKQLVDQFFPAENRIINIRLTFGKDSYLLLSGQGNEKIPVIIPDEYSKSTIFPANAQIFENVICNILLDINILESLSLENGTYVFRPTGRSYPETFGGTIKGSVQQKDIPFIVLAHKENVDTIATLTDRSGVFLFRGLNTGLWNITILGDDSLRYADSTFVDTVFQGKITTISPVNLKQIN